MVPESTPYADIFSPTLPMRARWPVNVECFLESVNAAYTSRGVAAMRADWGKVASFMETPGPGLKPRHYTGWATRTKARTLQFTTCPVQQNGHGMRVRNNKLYARITESRPAAADATSAPYHTAVLRSSHAAGSIKT